MTTLPQHIIDYLLTVKESGMGYHSVRVIFNDDTFIETVILNSSEVKDFPEDKTVEDIKTISIRFPSYDSLK